MTDNIQDIYRCTPRQTRAFIKDCIEAGLVPNVLSSPGMGKSSIVKSISEEFSLEVIDERLSTRSPVDLAGIPDFLGEGVNRRAAFTPFNVYPIEGTPIPKGKDGWTLFLDEFNSAPKSVQAAAYKLILDRMVGNHRLHPNTAIICAGNLGTDRAITNNLSTAMQSRLVHIEMMISHLEWLEDVAYAEGYDSRIIGYLNYKPNHLMDFRPDHQEKTFCCPRTWEFLNKLIKGKQVVDEKTALYAGTITSGVAVEFVTFTKLYANMPTIHQIVQDPEHMFIPGDQPTRWAVISHLMEKLTDANFADVCTYIDRFTLDFRLIFYRSVNARNSNLRTHPSYGKALSALSRYLHQD